MTAVLAITGGALFAIAALALILPCPACRKRRERLRAAIAKLNAKQR